MTVSNTEVTRRRSAREEILATAYELFTQRGIRAVGVDEVIAKSGVAKATLYKHFRSKDELAMAFLDRREQRWSRDFIEAGSAKRADDSEGQLLAIFDMLDEWYVRNDSFKERSFMSVLLEMGTGHPVGQACVQHLANLRTMVAGRAAAAGLAEPEEFALSFHILMEGSILLASEGDRRAALRAKEMARVLIDKHRPHPKVKGPRATARRPPARQR
jgi:AcrR family transcriptional regulator